MDPITLSVVIVLILGVAVAVTVVLVKAFEQHVWIWHSVVCRDITVQVVAPISPPVTDSQVKGAVNLAIDALSAVWTKATVIRQLEGVSIFVVNGSKWQNIAGQWVGGEQDGGVLKVDIGLTSLMHEMAHLMEFKLTGKTDDSHLMWQSNGLYAADNVYRNEVAGLGLPASGLLDAPPR